jgi:protein-disulfide isomerase
MFIHTNSFSTALLCAAALFSAATAIAEPLNSTQGDAILQELKQIRQLLERQQQRPAAPQAAAPAQEKLTIKLGQEYAIGKSNAPVTVIEYNDLQCPFCNRFHTAAFADIRKNYVDTGKVRFINRDMPLEDIHPQAIRASHAARCAGEQGKYWEVAGALITHQAGMSPTTIDQHAKQAGLDEAAYQSCMDSNRHADAIRASGAAARTLGISGTPTFVVGRVEGDTLIGQKLVGALPFASFEAVIRPLLEVRQ